MPITLLSQKKPPIIPEVHQNRSALPLSPLPRGIITGKNTSSTADEPNLIPFEVDHARIEQIGQSDVKLSPYPMAGQPPPPPLTLYAEGDKRQNAGSFQFYVISFEGLERSLFPSFFSRFNERFFKQATESSPSFIPIIRSLIGMYIYIYI